MTQRFSDYVPDLRILNRSGAPAREVCLSVRSRLKVPCHLQRPSTGDVTSLAVVVLFNSVHASTIRASIKDVCADFGRRAQAVSPFP